MQTSAMSEANFKQFNCQRLAMLTALVKEAESAQEACDAWLATGHIADYRTWQTRLRHLDEADAQYGGFLASPR
jgi:hypothetical protein